MIDQYIKGMLVISVEGVNLERFMNRCSANGIVLYNACKKKYDFLECAVKLSDFKAIARLNRELRCRIRVRKRYGLKFLFNRVKRRKAFVIGAAIFTVFLVILSSTVWRIDIKGIDRLTATQIINVINGQNMGVGVFKAKCDTKALELEIKKSLPDVDWVIVKLNGVVMNVEIIETVERISRIDTSPSRIISEVPCEIVSVNALRGDAKVKPGSTVNAGDILVDGISVCDPNSEPVYRVVNAMGRITAKVAYTGNATVKLDDVESKVYTGNTEKHLLLTMFGNTFGKHKPFFENYDTSVKEYSLFTEGRLFPIIATSTEYKEYYLLTDKERKGKALDELFTSACNDAMRQIPIGAEILSRDVEYEFDDKTKTFTATAKITAVHSVGVTQKITEDEIRSITGASLNNG